MNLVLDIDKYILENTHFLDTKRNIIIDGNFTKIIYSNELFTMNGIYFLFTIHDYILEKKLNKFLLRFNPYNKLNSSIIEELTNLEHKIIEYYKQMTNTTSKISNSLSKQLYSGNMKIYKEYNYSKKPVEENNKTTSSIIIKISGIWETREEMGITYKLFEITK
jgi:hypothetical protein